MYKNDVAIIYSEHAIVQMRERGASKKEVEQAVKNGEKMPAKKGRHAYRMNFQYDDLWGGKRYSIKQVMPIVRETGRIAMVITVYVFYF